MKFFYVTLNNEQEAKTISVALLERQLAVCTNWFPIQCAYRWEGEIKQENEVVLIIKTQTGMRERIETVISEFISYTNIIAELAIDSVNTPFKQWLDAEVSADAE